jgi:hypothetical protein
MPWFQSLRLRVNSCRYDTQMWTKLEEKEREKQAKAGAPVPVDSP